MMLDILKRGVSVPAESDDEMYSRGIHIAQFNCRKYALTAAHAINCHDDLVSALESVCNPLVDLTPELLSHCKAVLAKARGE